MKPRLAALMALTAMAASAGATEDQLAKFKSEQAAYTGANPDAHMNRAQRRAARRKQGRR